MLGGSSNLNAMLYVKGNDNDFKKWSENGNPEWNPDIVHKYYKKAENFQDANLLKYPNIKNFYGTNGPLTVNTFNSTYRDLTIKLLNAYNEIGFKNELDLNVANELGSGIARVTAYNGVRAGTDEAYLLPIQHRKNFKILKHSLVSKVLINSFSKKAYGVEVLHEGKKMIFFADLEVILSAGTVNSPQILLLSGIGPKDHLHSKNISCKTDLRMVGQNLQDHCIVPVTVYGNEPGEVKETENLFGAILYLYNRTGYLAQNSFTDILAFYSQYENASYPEYQSHLTIFWKNSSSIREAFNRQNYKKSVVDSIVKQNKNHTLYEFMFNLLHPYSRGNISLNTSNPLDHPLIYANYFDDHRDIESAVKGIKILTSLVNTTYFQSIGGFLGRINWPPCDLYELNSDEYWRCICISMVTTVYHPVGTCSMGSNSSNSVVDSRLKVHGVHNLRVIDASVMPYTTSGNTNAPTIMIAERGADLVKDDYKKL